MKTLLFDLDGTLIDPASGIIGSFQFALRALGRSAPAAGELHWIIGPAMRASFASVLGSGAQVEEALALYRARYSEQGIFDAVPYPGIHDALAALKREGFTLHVCTAKLESFAKRIITHFGFTNAFAGVYGSDPEGRLDDKGDLMQHLLAAEKIDPATACMIGDRKYDIAAASRNSMRSIGVLWGFGGQAELEQAGATAICANPRDLTDCVRTLA